VNLVGVRESARLNFFLALFDFATQLLLMLLGFILVLNFGTLVDNVSLGVAPEWSDFALGIALAMISYTGIETISNLAEEAREPRRLIPRAMRFVVLAVLVISAGVPAVALSAMPVTEVGGEHTSQLSTTYQDNPILGIVKNMDLGAFAGFMEVYVAVIAAVILLIATNAGVIGVSRLTYSMGQYQQVPDRLRRISPRSRTPTTAIMVFGVAACLVMIPGEAEFLGTMYAFGAMLSFTIGHSALIGLRWRVARSRMREIPGDIRVTEPEEDWYRAPLNVRVAGVQIPLFAVFGGIGTLGAWIAVMVLYPRALVAGWAWLAVGVVTYVLYRRHRGLSLTETSKVKLPPLAGVQPVEYAGVLVAFEEGTYSEDAMATALKLAAHKGGNILVLSTVTVPQHLSLDAPLEEAEETAQAVIETARQWVGRGRRVRGRIVKVRQGEAGHRIVREAQQAHSDAIVMPMPASRPTGGKVLSKTLETVLGKRPCRVIIDSAPAHALKPGEGPTAPREPAPV